MVYNENNPTGKGGTTMKKIISGLSALFLLLLLSGCGTTTTTSATTTEAVLHQVDYYLVASSLTIGETVLEEGDSFVCVDLGGAHSAALSATGRIFAWGNNEKGQLGDGTTTSRIIPTEITGQFALADGEILVFLALGDKFSAALTSAGRVFTWGWNYRGRLGDGTTTSKSVPTDITGQFVLHSGETIRSVSVGGIYCGALTTEGRVFTWGENGMSQLGDGTIERKIVPTEITSRFPLESGESVGILSLGFFHSAAITSEGRVFTWGNNSSGQLGDGTNYFSTDLLDITAQFGLGEGETVDAIFLGEFHSLAKTSLGRVFAWGMNSDGQLGDGTTGTRWSPVDITGRFSLQGEETVTAVSIGNSTSGCLTSLGRVFTWGDNYYGQLGDATTADQNEPVDITGQLRLAAGDSSFAVLLQRTNSAVLTAEGAIFCWGANEEGQLGDGTTKSRVVPKEITESVPVSTLSKTVYAGAEAILSPYEPLREGFRFSGWFLDRELSTPFAADSPVTGDLVLYGGWIPEE